MNSKSTEEEEAINDVLSSFEVPSAIVDNAGQQQLLDSGTMTTVDLSIFEHTENKQSEQTEHVSNIFTPAIDCHNGPLVDYTRPNRF